MYSLITLLSGLLIALLIVLNGLLAKGAGVFLSAVIIHVVGIFFSLLLMEIQKKPLVLKKELPLWQYAGGAVGVLATLGNNYAFGRIPVSTIIALGLFGQLLGAILVDRFGLFGMEKRRLGAASWTGLLFSLAGILVMLDLENPAVPALLCSLFSGVLLVAVRHLNAELSTVTGPLQGSFLNHCVGLPFTLLALFIWGQPELLSFTGLPSNPLAYLGGVAGVLVVLCFNLAVPKLSAFRVTLLSFSGQVGAGFLLDLLMGVPVDAKSFWGGLLVIAGVLLPEAKKSQKK